MPVLHFGREVPALDEKFYLFPAVPGAGSESLGKRKLSPKPSYVLTYACWISSFIFRAGPSFYFVE